MIESLKLLEASAAAFAAGGINAVSGGGTLLTFPTLIGLGVPAVQANATSTVALWPGVLGSLWGYRAELKGIRGWAVIIALPCIAGGLLGSLLLVGTKPALFEKLAPFLVLCATLLFMGHGAISRMLSRHRGETTDDEGDPPLTPRRILPYFLFQLVVGTYGGYFGAGMGILILAALGILGFKNIHRMNGLKAWAAFCANGAAIAVFIAHGLVDWKIGLTMAIGGILGGYFGARLARFVGQAAVRGIIVAVGLIATAALLYHEVHP